MTNEENKSIIQRAVEFAFGKPKAHQPPPGMNRKQRRTALAFRQKQVTKARIAARKRKGRK